MSEDSEIITDPSTLVWKQRIALAKSFFNTFGLPMLIIGYFAWGIRCIVIFCAPYFVDAAKQHVVTLDIMGKTQLQLTEQNKEIGQTQASIARSIETQSQNGREFVEISKSMARKLDDVHDVIVRKKDGKD